MAISTFILPSIAALGIFLLCILAVQMTNKQENLRNRLQRLAGETGPEIKQDMSEINPLYVEHEPSAFARFCEQVLRIFGTNTEKFKKKNQLRFYQSGIQSPDAPIYYLFFSRVAIIVFIGIAALLARQPATDGMHKLLHYVEAFMTLILGVFGADLYLKNARQKREKILQRSFPDALDLLLVCVESGLALDGALSRVCKELGKAHPLITQELNRTRLELTLLNDRAQALTNLSDRTDMLCFRSLVTTLLQSERFGTSLTETLRVLSEEFRNTRLMLAEEKAGRLPVMMTIPLITLMMPALFLVVLGPAMLKLFHTTATQ